MSNRVRSAAVRPDGSLLVDLALSDPDALGDLMRSAVAQFASVCADAPDTRTLLVAVEVLAPDVEVSAVTAAWRDAVASNAAASAQLPLFEQADALLTDAEGRALGVAPLSAPAVPSPSRSRA